MSAKSCASGKTVLDLWKQTDQTDRQLYSVQRASSTGVSIIGVSLRLQLVSSSGEEADSLKNWRQLLSAARAR